MKYPQAGFQRKTVIGLILTVIVSGFLLSKIALVHGAPQATKRLFENKIQPGEIYTYTVPEKKRISWERWLATKHKDDATRLELTFAQLSFGDGTGFVTTAAVPFPFKQTRRNSATAWGSSARQQSSDGGWRAFLTYT